MKVFKKKVNNRPTFVSFVEEPDRQSTRSSIQDPSDQSETTSFTSPIAVSTDELNLLPDELVVLKVDDVIKNVPFCNSGVFGSLVATTFRVAFIPLMVQDDDEQIEYRTHKWLSENDILLTNILHVFQVGKSKRKRLVGSTNSSGNLKGLEIQCKDMKKYTFSLENVESSLVKKFGNSIKHFSCRSNHSLVFSSILHPSIQPYIEYSYSNESSYWWEDLKRCNAIGYRVTSLNKHFRYFENLPEVMVVPSRLSDQELSEYPPSLSFPIWMFGHSNGTSLLRMSVHHGDNILNKLDEDKVKEITLSKPSSSSSPLTLSSSSSSSSFLPSLSALNESLINFQDICSPATAKEMWINEMTLFSSMEASNWLSHLSSFLSISVEVVRLMMDGYTVVLKDEKGRDESCIVGCLVEMMMVEGCRTMEGFERMVQKQWCAMGYSFCDRGGFLGNLSEQSPLFECFLECVWQMSQQFPYSFSFSSIYLLTLRDLCVQGISPPFAFSNAKQYKSHYKEVGRFRAKGDVVCWDVKVGEENENGMDKDDGRMRKDGLVNKDGWMGRDPRSSRHSGLDKNGNLDNEGTTKESDKNHNGLSFTPGSGITDMSVGTSSLLPQLQKHLKPKLEGLNLNDKPNHQPIITNENSRHKEPTNHFTPDNNATQVHATSQHDDSPPILRNKPPPPPPRPLKPPRLSLPPAPFPSPFHLDRHFHHKDMQYFFNPLYSLSSLVQLLRSSLHLSLPVHPQPFSFHIDKQALDNVSVSGDDVSGDYDNEDGCSGDGKPNLMNSSLISSLIGKLPKTIKESNFRNSLSSMLDDTKMKMRRTPNKSPPLKINSNFYLNLTDKEKLNLTPKFTPKNNLDDSPTPLSLHFAHPLCTATPAYKGVVVPKCGVPFLRVWDDYYLRWTVPIQVKGGGEVAGFLGWVKVLREMTSFGEEIVRLKMALQDEKEDNDKVKKPERRRSEYDNKDPKSPHDDDDEEDDEGSDYDNLEATPPLLSSTVLSSSSSSLEDLSDLIKSIREKFPNPVPTNFTSSFPHFTNQPPSSSSPFTTLPCDNVTANFGDELYSVDEYE